MKRLVFAALTVSLFLMIALQAAAQYGDEPTGKIGFRVGVFSPTGDKLGDEKNLWRCMGLEYSLTNDDLKRSTLLLSAIVTGTDTGLVQADVTGIQAEKRWYMNPSEVKGAYLGAGLGYYKMSTKVRDFQWEDWTDRSGGKLGFTASAGYQLNEGISAGVHYSSSGKLDNGLSFSGLGVDLGMRLQF